MAMVTAMRALKRVGLVVGVLLLATGAYSVWYVYGAWPVPEGYEFPRHSLWGAGPTGLFEGELVEEDGCIRTSGEGGATVVWPPGYSLQLNDGRLEIHGGGHVAAMGEPVRLGGGWYETRSQHPTLLPETRCPAPFMLSTGFAD